MDDMERGVRVAALRRPATATNVTRSCRVRAALAAIALAAVSLHAQQPTPPSPEPGFRFKSGVELINVTASVFDASGRFVPGLQREDFIVYEDDQPQSVSHFTAERVPVSLGIAVDTSGSMVGEKIRAAQTALDCFLYDLLGPEDEIFLYRFSDRPVLLQGWTTDRALLSRALGRVTAAGATSMYDAVAEAVGLAATGRHRKKALLVLSDGNDTTSKAKLGDVKQVITETDALVYAIGIDCGVESDRPLRESPRFPTARADADPISLPAGRSPRLASTPAAAISAAPRPHLEPGMQRFRRYRSAPRYDR
jgi:hypothetical protein